MNNLFVNKEYLIIDYCLTINFILLNSKKIPFIVSLIHFNVFISNDFSWFASKVI